MTRPFQFRTIRDYRFQVYWSEDDEQWVGACVEFPSLSHLAESPAGALDGIFRLLETVIDDMKRRGEPLPPPGNPFVRG